MERARSLTPATILVVEDDPEIRCILSATLQDEGHSVVEAVDGKEALAVARERQLDLILLDLGLPRLNGRDFCRIYRGDGGRVPIILVTAASPLEVTLGMTVCHPAAYVAKPFELERLVETVEAQLRPADRL